MKKLLFLIGYLILFNYNARAQHLLHGRVTDALNGKPLDGATIRSGGRAVASDSSGTFSLSLPGTAADIVVSYTGYQTSRLHVRLPLRDLQVKLRPDNRQLDEVIVSTGYQTLPKERATGSFAQVDSALFNRSASSDVLQRLEGMVPGLLFNRNTAASAGGADDISIRGTSTLFANTQPLVVVDGFPYDGAISNIDPNSVASITVLKDAAAASIWGVKSGNGVIVITTRHGHRFQPLRVDVNTSLTLGNRPNVFYSPDFLDANDFINVEEKLFKLGYDESALSSVYGVVSPVVSLLAQEKAGTITAADANTQINALRKLDVRNDLEKYFYRGSAEQQYALDLSGGGEQSDYFISGGYDNNLMNQTGNNSSRVTLNSLYNFYPAKNLSVSAGWNFAQTSATANSPLANINSGGGYSTIYPYAQLNAPIVKDYAAAYTDTAGGGRFLNWKYNPLTELQDADNTGRTLDNRLSLALKYHFLPGLTAEARYAYERQQSSTANDYSEQTYYARNLINRFTETDGSGNLVYPVPLGGILQSAEADLAAQRGRLQLDYNPDWKGRSSLSVIAGAEINQTITTTSAQTIYGYDQGTLTDQSVDFTDYFPNNPDGNYDQIPNTEGLGKYTDRYISYYSNAAYTYDQRYTLSLSGRIDKSNLFGVNTNQQSVPLYSAGLSWNISKEPFYHLDWLPEAKLRATYGYNGNTDNSVTALTTFEQISGAALSGNPYAVIVSPGNPELRWERDRIINLGIDLGSKGQALSGSFEYYWKRGLDLIGGEPLAPSTGFSEFRGNSADIDGRGLDLVLNARIVSGPAFSWQSSFLLSHVLDIVSKYDAPSDVPSYLAGGDGNGGSVYPLAGKPLYAIYSYRWAGLTHDTGDPQGYLNGKVSTDYDAIIAGTSIAGMDYNGPSRPSTFGSFRNTFSYRQISLSFNIIYKLGYVFRRTSINYGGLFQGWVGNSDFDKRWMKPGDEAHTNVPSIEYPPLDDNRDQFYEYSSVLVDNGDVVRLQDMTLNYDLTPLLSKAGPFSGLQVYAYINNIGILWRANPDGLDPDLYTGALPQPATFSLGIKANLK